MKVTERMQFTILESPVLLDLLKIVEAGEWRIVELRIGRVNWMKIKKVEKYKYSKKG